MAINKAQRFFLRMLVGPNPPGDEGKRGPLSLPAQDESDCRCGHGLDMYQPPIESTESHDTDSTPSRIVISKQKHLSKVEERIRRLEENENRRRWNREYPDDNETPFGW